MLPVAVAGEDSFEEIRKQNIFYIDKTYFIKEWWESKTKVSLITRPRRFGKTLNMNMLDCFFSLKYSNRSDLFEGLSIWKDKEYREIQGTYPVINLSFASVKGICFEDVREIICQLITNVYKKNCDYELKNKITDTDKDFVQSVNRNMSTGMAMQSLQVLSEILYSVYGKKVIILLDEYDTPLIEAYTHGYWDEMTEFMRGLFNATFKSNPALYRGLLTGITRISKESMFSDLNNLKVCTTTSREYATCFGFTEEEVFEALDTYGLGDKKEAVKRWYDGPVFGNQKDMYNPWSIICFMTEGTLKNYWVNTSSNVLVNQLMQTGSKNIKMELEDLLQEKSVFVEIEEETSYNQLDNNPKAIWGLLVASGYIKVVQICYVDDNRGQKKIKYELRITNEEVYQMFANFVNDWFHSEDTGDVYNAFLQAMLEHDLELMNEYMNEVALNVFSSFDTGNHPGIRRKPENFYHGFVLGLMMDLYSEYEIKSNRESGLGRYDVMLIPKNLEKDAFVLEFKVFHPSKEKTLEDTVKSAMKQIDEKKYVATLLEKGIPRENIYCYGFAFEGKKVLIGTGN